MKVSPSDVLQAMSGSYTTIPQIVAGGGPRARHGGHHGGRRGGRGFGGPIFYDSSPDTVFIESQDEACDGALYAPSGNMVCPGDPGYDAIRRSMSHAATGDALALIAMAGGKVRAGDVVRYPPHIAVGGVVRTNPLPPGRYWVDVFQSKQAGFDAWLGKNKGSVKIEETESFSGDMDAGYEARNFYIFSTSSPVMWEGPGLPTTAEASVKSSSDTVQKPPPETPGSILDSALPSVSTPAKMGMVAAGVGLGLFALVMVMRR